MRNDFATRWGRLLLSWGAVVAFGLGASAKLARGQEMTGAELMDFKAQLESYPDGHPKTTLEGAKAQPLPNGRFLLTDAKLVTFNTNDSVEIQATTPQCFFDSNKRTAQSPGKLRLWTADRRLLVEGVGFLWSQADSSLVLSNQVHTVMREDLLVSQEPNGVSTNARAGEKSRDVEVFSDEFAYNRDLGRAIYRGHVRAAGTDLQLAATNLTLELPTGGGPLKSIVAEGDVVMTRGELHVTGDRTVYTASNNVTVVTGQPAWSMGRQEGRADELVVNRTDNIFRGNGHAFMRLPGNALGSGLLLNPAQAQTNSAGATNRFVEIASDSYELRTNLLVFRGRVQGAELVANQRQGSLDCDLLTIWLSASNQVREIVTEGNVMVEQNGFRVMAGRGAFSGTNSVAEFSGNPFWQWGLREGSADRLVMDRAGNEMKALGHARLKVPASQMQVLEMKPASAIPANSAEAEGRLVSISCDEYDLKEDRGVFRGNVNVQDPPGRLFCDLLTAELSQKPGEVHRTAVALQRQNRVEIVWVDSAGQTNYAWCGKAVYTYSVANGATNELVTLSENPVVTDSQRTTTGDTIVYDPIHGTVRVTNERAVIRLQDTNSPARFREPATHGTNPPTTGTQKPGGSNSAPNAEGLPEAQ